MPSTALTAATYEPTVTRPGIVLVSWWADWSGPCRKFALAFEQAARTHDDLTFTTVDVLAEPQLAVRMEVTSVPDLMVFRDGTLVYDVAAMLSGEQLAGIIAAARAVDMAEVTRGSGA